MQNRYGMQQLYTCIFINNKTMLHYCSHNIIFQCHHSCTIKLKECMGMGLEDTALLVSLACSTVVGCASITAVH